jgi:imidazolonepropionase-like amidohydrolase
MARNTFWGDTIMIRFLTGVLGTILMSTALWAQDNSETTVIHAGWLLAIPGQAPASEQSIIIIGDRIDRIEAGYVSPDGAVIIDLSDQYVLPGLIDSHVHLLGELNPNRRLQNVTFSSANRALDGADGRLYQRAGRWWQSGSDCGLA